MTSQWLEIDLQRVMEDLDIEVGLNGEQNRGRR
jgi:hypothetical protein